METHRLIQFFYGLSGTLDWCTALCGHEREGDVALTALATLDSCNFRVWDLEGGGMFCYSFFQNLEQKHPLSCRRRVLVSLSLPRELCECAAKCFCFCYGFFFICVKLVTTCASPIGIPRDIYRS